jgi:hypothetical protein
MEDSKSLFLLMRFLELNISRTVHRIETARKTPNARIMMATVSAYSKTRVSARDNVFGKHWVIVFGLELDIDDAGPTSVLVFLLPTAVL